MNLDNSHLFQLNKNYMKTVYAHYIIYSMDVLREFPSQHISNKQPAAIHSNDPGWP